MTYINGMVAAVPTASKDAYAKFAAEMAAVFKEHGAVDVVDAWGIDVPPGQQTDFFRAVQATPEETVAFSWIAWKDKASHDAGWERVMQDPRMASAKMPFDGKRMIYGGFEKL
jgi:uncharacterized protein YbaA (DUF1428 family)